MCCWFSRERPKDNDFEKEAASALVARVALESPPGSQQGEVSENAKLIENGPNKPNYSARSLLKSASISASQCVVVKPKKESEVSEQ